MDDEIDLRKYIDVLLRRWKLIVSITVIAVFIAGLVSFLSPRVYEAKAVVLIAQSGSGTLSRQILVSVAKSNAVATQVIEHLGDKLKPKERKPEVILDKVQVGGEDNLFEISVKNDDPQTAAAIANAWPKPFENYVNSLYRSLAQLPEGLIVQADSAKKEYEKKQRALEDFLSSSRVDELQRQIADRELLCDIKSLREQIKAGTSSSASAVADSLALVLLQAQAFTVLPSGLQISLDAASNLKTDLGDIDALISTLEARSGGTKGQSITELRQEILQLQGELEQEKAKQREMETLRGFAWKAYTTVASNVVDTEVADPAQGATVQVVRDAAAPQSPVTPHRWINIGIALVLGLVIGVFATFMIEYFGKTAEQRKDTEKES